MQPWRAHVSHCVCVLGKDRQNEKTVHIFPQRSQHCLPPTGKQREENKNRSKRVFINHTLPFVHPPPTLASLPLSLEDAGCERVKDPAEMCCAVAKFPAR